MASDHNYVNFYIIIYLRAWCGDPGNGITKADMIESVDNWMSLKLPLPNDLQMCVNRSHSSW